MTPKPEGDVAAARKVLHRSLFTHDDTYTAAIADVADALAAARAQGEASGRNHAAKLVEALADSLERVASRAAGVGQPNTSRVFQEAMSYLRNGAAALREAPK